MSGAFSVISDSQNLQEIFKTQILSSNIVPNVPVSILSQILLVHLQRIYVLLTIFQELTIFHQNVHRHAAPLKR